MNLTRGIAIACVLALLVAGGLWWTLKDANTKHVTAFFPTTVGLYENSSVRVLGIEVGEVQTITPQGDRVKVEMTYDRKISVPADAKAVIISPSLVAGRYVQLLPTYESGPELNDGAVIPLNRTAVPLGYDSLTESLDQVAESLGPEGANSDGELSRLLDTLASNFGGNGRMLHETITKLSQASKTLSENQGDLFATVRNLADFTSTLAGADQQVRTFSRKLAQVSDFLAGERKDLAATVDQLGVALKSVRQFVENNNEALKSNVDKLASVTQVLVEQRSALAEILSVAPVALSNLVDTYNGASGTLDARPVLNELTQPPLYMVCNLLAKGVNQVQGPLGQACSEVSSIMNQFAPLPSVAQTLHALQQGKLPPLPLPLIGDTATGMLPKGGDQ